MANLQTYTLGNSVVYCCRCGEATTRLEALLRKFHTGYSACCNENLVTSPPKRRVKSKVYKGDAPGYPVTGNDEEMLRW